MDNIEDEFFGTYDDDLNPPFNGVENDIDSFIASLNIPRNYCLVDFDLSESGILGENAKKVATPDYISCVNLPLREDGGIIHILKPYSHIDLTFPMINSGMFKDCKRAETIAIVHCDYIVASYRI